MDHWLIPWIIPAFALGVTSLRMLDMLPFCASSSPPATVVKGYSRMLASQATGACQSLTLQLCEFITANGGVRSKGNGGAGKWTQ